MPPRFELSGAWSGAGLPCSSAPPMGLPFRACANGQFQRFRFRRNRAVSELCHTAEAAARASGARFPIRALNWGQPYSQQHCWFVELVRSHSAAIACAVPLAPGAIALMAVPFGLASSRLAFSYISSSERSSRPDDVIQPRVARPCHCAAPDDRRTVMQAAGQSRSLGCGAAQECAVQVRCESASCPRSVALHYMHYNFCRIQKTLRVTPAMAAGVTDRLWSVADIVTVLEAWERAA